MDSPMVPPAGLEHIVTGFLVSVLSVAFIQKATKPSDLLPSLNIAC